MDFATLAAVLTADYFVSGASALAEAPLTPLALATAYRQVIVRNVGFKK